MYMRIIRGQAQPGQVEELARRWQEFVAPRLRATPGVRNAYAGGNRDANTVAVVSVFERRPDEATMEALNRGVEEFRRRAQDLVSGEPVIEEYEILAQV